MNVIQLYQDFGIEYRTEGHKHTRPGWVNVECPFCTGNTGFHLGWNVQEEYYFCWRCGWHPPIQTVAQVLSIPDTEAVEIVKQYGVTITPLIRKQTVEKQRFSLPQPVGKLTETARKYLLKRGFDPDEIVDKWGVQCTGNFAKLDKIDYRFRIVIPYIWNGQVVSFDARDYTEKQQNKYQACPKHYEIMEHKKILYCNQEKLNPELGICVEGPTDVWRLGTEAFAVSGIEYTNAQVRSIATIFRRVAVVFDYEPQAQIQAKKLVAELRFRGVDAFSVKIENDPGSMTNSEAKKLLKQIRKT